MSQQDQHQGRMNRYTRSKSVSNNKNIDGELWKCKICKKKISDDSAKIVQCEYCSEYYCSTCLQITNDEYESFNSPLLHWFCPKCDEKVMKNLKQEREIEERCAAFMQGIENRIVRL